MGLKRDSRFAPVVGVELANLFQDRYVTQIPVVGRETRRPHCSTRPGVRLHQGSTVLDVKIIKRKSLCNIRCQGMRRGNVLLCEAQEGGTGGATSRAAYRRQCLFVWPIALMKSIW